MTITVNEHGAVFLDGEVVGWISHATCENEHCLVDIAAGRPWHATSRGFAVVLQPNHFATREEAIAAVVDATEPCVDCGKRVAYSEATGNHEHMDRESGCFLN